jgi:hypothetical protein
MGVVLLGKVFLPDCDSLLRSGEDKALPWFGFGGVGMDGGKRNVKGFLRLSPPLSHTIHF